MVIDFSKFSVSQIRSVKVGYAKLRAGEEWKAFDTAQKWHSSTVSKWSCWKIISRNKISSVPPVLDGVSRDLTSPFFSKTPGLTLDPSHSPAVLHSLRVAPSHSCKACRRRGYIHLIPCIYEILLGLSASRNLSQNRLRGSQPAPYIFRLPFDDATSVRFELQIKSSHRAVNKWGDRLCRS